MIAICVSVAVGACVSAKGGANSPCVCALGAGCHRVQSGQKRATVNHSIKVHKKGDASGHVFHLCDTKELKIHREVYELTASVQETKSLDNNRSKIWRENNVVSNKKHNKVNNKVNNKKTSLANAQAKEEGKKLSYTDYNKINNKITNAKTSLANAKAKEAGKTEAQRRGISVALTGTQFKEKWLQGMYLHSQGPNRTHAKATLDFMAGKRVGYIFAQGEHFSIV